VLEEEELDVIAVAGVDGATKNLGLARPDGSLVTLNARAGAKDPIRRLAELERGLWRALELHPPKPDLVVVEGYGLGTPGRLALVRLGEVGGMVRTTAFRMAAEVVEVSPSSLKRFATGNGAARKEAMVARALELGAVLSSPGAHDEADAFHARRLGRMGTGELRAELDHELEVLASLVWPVFPADDDRPTYPHLGGPLASPRDLRATEASRRPPTTFRRKTP
jgi:Holliday junction resolvasome RuvABC endonuclease subunit